MNGCDTLERVLVTPTVHLVAINSQGHIFAATTFLGIFRSTNNGDGWTQLGFMNTSVYSLAINAQGVLFAGLAGAVQRSTNNGSGWTPVGLYGKTVTELSIDSSGSILAAASDSVVYRSTDNGDNWAAVGLAGSITNSFAYVGGENTFACAPANRPAGLERNKQTARQCRPPTATFGRASG